MLPLRIKFEAQKVALSFEQTPAKLHLLLESQNDLFAKVSQLCLFLLLVCGARGHGCDAASRPVG